jgi:hypothetical protein
MVAALQEADAIFAADPGMAQLPIAERMQMRMAYAQQRAQAMQAEEQAARAIPPPPPPRVDIGPVGNAVQGLHLTLHDAARDAADQRPPRLDMHRLRDTLPMHTVKDLRSVFMPLSYGGKLPP